MGGRGQVVILNGTGSAGKTTLARALQDRAEAPLVHLGIDAFVHGLPPRYRGGSHASEGLSFRFDSDGKIAALDAGPVMHGLIRGMHRAVAAMASAGTSLVVDHVMWEDAWYRDCALVLPSALFVGVHCSREVLTERTRARGDRPPGHELFAFDTVHAGRVYDVEVDTSDGDVTRCVDAILERLGSGPPRAFATMKRGGTPLDF